MVWFGWIWKFIMSQWNNSLILGNIIESILVDEDVLFFVVVVDVVIDVVTVYVVDIVVGYVADVIRNIAVDVVIDVAVDVAVDDDFDAVVFVVDAVVFIVLVRPCACSFVLVCPLGVFVILLRATRPNYFSFLLTLSI